MRTEIINKNKRNFITSARFVSGRIMEYDMRAANISVLAEIGKITEEEYLYFLNFPKQNREVQIQKKFMITDIDVDDEYRTYDEYKKIVTARTKELNKSIHQGIAAARMSFYRHNNIDDDMLVRVSSDAIYINSTVDPKYTKFGKYIDFRLKNIFNNMIKLPAGVLIFSSYPNNSLNVDIKGIGKNLYLHRDYMVNFLANTIYLAEKVSVRDALVNISAFYEEYVNCRLPLDYYREFNSFSGFRVKDTNYIFDNCNSLELIDINYNLSIIRELYSILLERYGR